MNPEARLEGDDALIKHDPHSERNDLLTLLEARARIAERIKPLRRRTQELEAAIDGTEDDVELRRELDQYHAELERCEQALLRYSERLK